MKHFLRRQLTNIVFLVLIVAAALTIYLLSRSEPAVSLEATPTVELAAMPSSTPVPSPTARAMQSGKGVPESVWQTHLATSRLFSAKASRRDKRSLTLTYGASHDISAQLLYTVDNGCVSSFELSFAAPPQATPASKKSNKSAIEQYLEENSKTEADKLQEAVLDMLSDLLPACDAESNITLTMARYWANQALSLEKNGDDFEDSQDGYRFLAYRATQSGEALLICSLYLN
ncbi:MAG: hypothetical protein GX417_01585 [Clostridiales bacterium]|nr:hypothetical protein [Clostridiales bacterium]